MSEEPQQNQEQQHGTPGEIPDSNRPDWAGRGIDPGGVENSSPSSSSAAEKGSSPAELSLPEYGDPDIYTTIRPSGSSASRSSGGFNAQVMVEELYYDLRPYVEDFGTIPEPTDARLKKYQEFEMSLLKDREQIEGLAAQDDEGKVNLEAIAKLLDMDSSTRQKMRAALSELCAGKPSQDIMYRIPPRVLTQFYIWISGELGKS